MVARPHSHHAAHRHLRGSLTAPAAMAVIAVAALTLGACTAPAAGRAVIEPDTADRAALSQLDGANRVFIEPDTADRAALSQLDGANRVFIEPDTADRAALARLAVAATLSGNPGDGQDSLRAEHLPNAANNSASPTDDSWDSLRQEHQHGDANSGS
jgi:hypothetical protein